MAKTKHLKYRRVRSLPNVILPEGLPAPFPWSDGPMAEKELVLELGCGKGEHALTLARSCPDRLVVGVDIKSHRLCTGGEQALSQGLSNLFFLRWEIGEIQACFKAGSVSEIWITFPDPHPKQREIKHRLTAPAYMAVYARLLVPGGRVHLKTDSLQFYEFTLGVVADWGGAVEQKTRDLYGPDALLPGSGVPEAAGVSSAFEKKALSRCKTIKYLRFSLT